MNLKDQKLISIIIAVYNCEEKIKATLDSVFSQNQDLFELVVIDGASTDKTLEIIKNCGENLTLISEKDEGIYEAFNKGLANATGRYIYFLGAGDLLRPNVLEQIKDLLPLDRPTYFYGLSYFTQQKVINGREFTPKIFTNDNVCHQAVFCHCDVYKIVGNFDTKYKVFADWFHNLRCFLDTRVEKKFAPVIIADYEEGGISGKISNDPVFQKDFPVFVRKNLGFVRYLYSLALIDHQNAYIYYCDKTYSFKYRFKSILNLISRRLNFTISRKNKENNLL